MTYPNVRIVKNRDDVTQIRVKKSRHAEPKFYPISKFFGENEDFLVWTSQAIRERVMSRLSGGKK